MKENPQSEPSDLYKRLTRLRWQVPLLALLLVLIHQLIEHTFLIHLPRWQHFATQVLFYGLVGPSLALLALTSLRKSLAKAEQATEALVESQNALEQANRRLSFLIDLNHRLASAEDEETLIELVLEVPLEIVAATGCSLIRFDEGGHPMQALHFGDLEISSFEALAGHLSSEEMRERCSCCISHASADPSACPLLQVSSTFAPVEKVFCLSLSSGGREFGVLNIYLPDGAQPNEEERELLQTMANEVSLALGSLRLQSRELEALYRLQQVRKLSDMHADLEAILSETVDALEVDGGVIFLNDATDRDLKMVAEVGDLQEDTQGVILGLAQGALQAEKPFLLSDLSIEQSGEIIHSLLFAPIASDAQTTGALVLWGREEGAFSRRYIQLIGAVAGQTALLVENHRLYLRVEHVAALSERARLAREIHDGLAQTLGYLKLRSTQMQDWMQEGYQEQVSEGLGEMAELLGEAYIEAREAIDGLRFHPQTWEMPRWLGEVFRDFSEMCDIRLETGPVPELELPPEIQAQLLRIIQEALGNVRKHSQASFVDVVWATDENWITLSIADDGRGFNPSEVPLISQHGLHTMRERSELIGADFQIQSKPGSGTKITVRLPVLEIKQDWPHA